MRDNCPQPRLIFLLSLLMLLTPVSGAPRPAISQQLPEPEPPRPPIHETFDNLPQLSLFPRLGNYRPEDNDSKRLPYWRTYLEHLKKTSGVIMNKAESKNQVFAFRSIEGIDSVGFFSPIAVTPNTSYQVSLKISATLPEGAETGIGIIEYDRFLWLAEQYPESIDLKYRTAASEGVRLTKSSDWSKQSFQFTAGPKTEMVHLILFREGVANRVAVLIDDLSIEAIK